MHMNLALDASKAELAWGFKLGLLEAGQAVRATTSSWALLLQFVSRVVKEDSVFALLLPCTLASTDLTMCSSQFDQQGCQFIPLYPGQDPIWELSGVVAARAGMWARSINQSKGRQDPSWQV